MVKHHIVNRCRGGSNTPDNLLLFDENRERAWHFLFGNKDFLEVSELLIRTLRIKNRQKK